MGSRTGSAPDAPLHLWPKVHYKYISYRNAPSDLRTVWEPSRFRWARPEDFHEAFESWTGANPVSIGPNWASSLEVAVRAVNWVFLLEAAGSSFPRGMRSNAIRWLAAHANHLLRNPEPHPPNHALGRALGLFVLGGYLDGFPGAGEWFRVGQREFSALFSSVFLPDGTFAEGAPGYAAFAIEMGLIYLALASEWAIDPGGISHIIQKALGFLTNLAWPDGSLPVFGDFDDGGVLRPRGTCYMAHLAQFCQFLGLGLPEPEGTRHYSDGGFLIIRRDGLCFASRVDDDPSLPGGHMHSDLGSFVLWMGEPLIVDPGVYLYTGPSSMREELRSETAHNLCWLEGKPMHLRDPRKPFTLEGRTKALFSGWE
ncbi:MAG: heparinase II/III domain-containing protein, partial [Candidatus Hydrothermia bacterium]